MSSPVSPCRICRGRLEALLASTLEHTVSSGCIIVPQPARVVQCQACGLVQKIDSQIVAEYEDYVIFDNNPIGDKIVRRPGQVDSTRSQIVANLLVERL